MRTHCAEITRPTTPERTDSKIQIIPKPSSPASRCKSPTGMKSRTPPTKANNSPPVIVRKTCLSLMTCYYFTTPLWVLESRETGHVRSSTHMDGNGVNQALSKKAGFWPVYVSTRLEKFAAYQRRFPSVSSLFGSIFVRGGIGTPAGGAL